MDEMRRYGANDRTFALAALHEGLYLARVVSQSKGMYRIATERGESFAEVSGKFRFDRAHAADFPAVGDFVMVDRLDDAAGNAIIHEVLPRTSVFERTAAGDAGESQIIAANVDVLFVCMALNEDYNLSRLERYVSSAWASGALPVVVLTKADLADDLESAMDDAAASAPGVDIVATMCDDKETVKAVLDHLAPGKTASFVGSSGVGKSTLVNLIAGSELLETGAVRADGKGRHTTTRRELIVLPEGRIVIDTPGMREFGIESADVGRTFSDIDEIAAGCRFSDCKHDTEPGCAVRCAIEQGVIDERRLESYRKLEREAAYAGKTSRQIEAQKLGEMFEDVGGMKNARKYIRQTDKRR